MFWKYPANLQENTHVEKWFQEGCFATLLKSHLGMGVLLIFSEHLFLGAPLGGCFWNNPKSNKKVTMQSPLNHFSETDVAVTGIVLSQ